MHNDPGIDGDLYDACVTSQCASFAADSGTATVLSELESRRADAWAVPACAAKPQRSGHFSVRHPMFQFNTSDSVQADSSQAQGQQGGVMHSQLSVADLLVTRGHTIIAALQRSPCVLDPATGLLSGHSHGSAMTASS